MKPRSPIVTILGHVDHGKTSLLDYIRKSRITAKEHGGITQKIGAYEIATGLKGYSTDRITFIDTPGHEAFSQLRARGANVADIAILIIDAKDSLMPQTIESISHIKAANIPFIVALNKIDLPDVNTEKVKNDLLKHEVLVEGKGGNIPVVGISAKTGQGIPELLETILLVTADASLQYDPEAPSESYIIETKKDKRGIIASCIIKQGFIRVGDVVYANHVKAKVKSLLNDVGTPLKEIYPSTPFELLGFSDLPEVGTKVTPTEGSQKIEGQQNAHKPIDARAFLQKAPEEKKLTLIIKADSQGSLEAIVYKLKENDNLEILLQAVGEVTKSDIFLAKTVKAIVISFGVNVPSDVKEAAKQEKVIIKSYNIIYELLEELQEVSEVLKEKEEEEKHLKGEAKILATFMIEGEKIFGVKVHKGKINLGDQVEVYRGENMLGKARVVSLKNRAKSVEEIKRDGEGGIIFSPPLDTRVGDVVKSIS